MVAVAEGVNGEQTMDVTATAAGAVGAAGEWRRVGDRHSWKVVFVIVAAVTVLVAVAVAASAVARAAVAITIVITMDATAYGSCSSRNCRRRKDDR